MSDARNAAIRDETRQYPESIKATKATPGRKRWKSTGVSFHPVPKARRRAEPRTDLRPPVARVEKGEWDDGVTQVVDFRRPVNERPLGTKGEALILDYYRHKAFEAALEGGLPVGKAGEVIGLKPPEATRLKRKLEDRGGAFLHFAREALRLIQEGRVPRGRATAQSGVADAFFTTLAGGPGGMSVLVSELGGQGVIDAGLLAHKEEHPALREATDYLINTWIRHGDSGKDLKCK